MAHDINGYVSDIPYLRDFKPMLAPAWLDHVALVAGVEPPARREGFAWCDLGCGQGVTAAVLAATHPAGIFHGIDAMGTHISHARGLAAEAAISNVRFHAADFAAALELELPHFDYIVAHGVYTWIDRGSQHALRRFIEQRLKPDGLAYLGYNAMPGWARDLPFQRMLRELGRSIPGDNAVRVTAAAELIGSLAAAGVPSLAQSFIRRALTQRPADYPAAYLVHEFLPAAWQPLYVTELRAAMAASGLLPVGSATLNENFDRMVLNEEARRLLSAVSDTDVRELVRDFFLDQRFRCDVFARRGAALGAEERADRLVSGAFALGRPLPAIRYTMTTPSGPLVYDNPTSRAIVAGLAEGPRSLTGLARPASQSDVRTILTLCAAGDVMPVESGRAAVRELNRALLRRCDGPEEIRWIALPCGTALELDRDLIRRLRDGGDIDECRFPGWRDFIAAHGVFDQ